MPASSRLQSLRRRTVLTAGAAGLLAAASPAVRGQAAPAYPARPVKFLVNAPAGSSPDVVMRIIAQKLSDTWGQAALVENRVGAGGIVGAQVVATSPPDGYTFLYTINSVISANPHLYPKLSYDPIKGFVPVALAVNLGYVLLASSTFKGNSVAELIAAAKAQPGKLNFTSAGVGAGNHVTMELFKDMTGTDMVHIPMADSAQGVLTGTVDVAMVPYTTALPLVRTGRARPLGVSLAKRLPQLPDVPTIAERVPGFNSSAWHGVFAPAGTPQPIVDKVAADVIATLKMPDVAARLADLSLDPVALPSREFAQFIREDYEKWGRLIRKLNITVN